MSPKAKKNTDDKLNLQDLSDNWSGDWSDNAVIKVIGIGGGGNNAVQHMSDKSIEGVDFICANTDLKALRSLRVDGKLRLGEKLTKGLGAGANPDKPRTLPAARQSAW